MVDLDGERDGYDSNVLDKTWLRVGLVDGDAVGDLCNLIEGARVVLAVLVGVVVGDLDDDCDRPRVLVTWLDSLSVAPLAIEWVRAQRWSRRCVVDVAHKIGQSFALAEALAKIA